MAKKPKKEKSDKPKPQMVRVEALKPHPFAGMLYQPGDVYEAADKEADTIVARGWATKEDPSKRSAKPLSGGTPESHVFKHD